MSPKKASTTSSPSKITSADIRSAKDKRTAAAKRKHEPVIVSDDSDIEIVENKSPAKKIRSAVAQLDSPPSPGSQGYRNLPAVSVSDLVSAAMNSATSSGSGRPIFGSLGSEVDNASEHVDKQGVDVARPERVKVKTEKAMYAEKVREDSSMKDNSPARRKGKNRETPPSPIRPLNLKKIAPVQTARDASPEMSEIEWPSTPLKSIKLEDLASDVAWSDQEPDKDSVAEKPKESCDALQGNSDDTSSVNMDCDLENEDPLMQVMLKSIQDPDLAPIYEDLPDLGNYRSVRQYSYVNTVGMGVVTFKEIQKRMVNDDIARLLRALLFKKSGIFVNPARVAPDIFVSEHGRLKLNEPSSMAVCLMTGIITDCAIVSEGFTGPENEKTVHKVSIAPFRQDFRRDTTMWGKVLNFDNISCAISTEGVSFTTKPRTLSAPIFSNASPSTPKNSKKTGSRSMTVVHSPGPSRRSDNYVTSHSFEQKVPIYDGRSVKGAREFCFSDGDFSKLSTWPLYAQGLQDLPYDAVVSVGYTLNTFGDGPRGGPNGVSTNLQFVILLALPVDD